MISLNTLRTRFGVVLSIVIVLALLAFIISLGPEMGFFGSNDPKVGEINGDNITYTEYLKEYETIKKFSGADESSEEAINGLSTAAWQSLVAKHLLVPGFEDLGIVVSKAERLAMLSGEHPSDVFLGAFANPETGEYDVAALSSFLAQVSSNPQYQELWSYLNDQAQLDRLMVKYSGLVKAGVYANALDVQQGLASMNESRNGRYVLVEYNKIADSLATVTTAEAKKYYEDNKEISYKKLPHRALTYVVFDVAATADDMTEIEKKVKIAGEEFAAAEDARAFIRKNMGTVGDHYASLAELSGDEAILLDGQQYGPVLKSNEWVISRPLAVKEAPDSLGLSHIVLAANNTALVDSLYNALVAGANFEEAAKKHSAYAQTAQLGGDVGVVPFSALTVEMADQLATAKKGDLVKVAQGDAIQILKVTRVDKPAKHVLVGTVTYPVEASSATRRNVHNTASLFAVEAKTSLDAFNAAASASAVSPRVARINQGQRTIASLENSRELVRWAYSAKVGEISEIFNLGDAYVVAMLTDIDDSEYTNFDDVRLQIAQYLQRDKKFEILKNKFSGATIEEVAKNAGVEPVAFEELRFTDYGITDVAIEPRVVGAIANTTETGKVSAPVKGYSGAVVFVVDAINKSEVQTPEAEKVRLQANKESLSAQAALMSIQAKAEIEDLRGQYF
ncbi:MAG: SurA N-terminal domain-containing protein [Alistipes sp.]|nr:SurA N-terminal domain-containing protein [Alistipes sp.]